jgi:hypothetical protein
MDVSGARARARVDVYKLGTRHHPSPGGLSQIGFGLCVASVNQRYALETASVFHALLLIPLAVEKRNGSWPLLAAPHSCLPARTSTKDFSVPALAFRSPHHFCHDPYSGRVGVNAI